MQLRDEKWAVDRVAADARAYLEAQAAKAIVEPPAEPEPPPTSRLPRQPVKGDSATFIYAISSNGLVKIGRSSNLRLRVSNIRVDNPHSVEVLAYHEVPRLVGKHIELLLHAVFDLHYAGGEWFNIEPARA